MTEQGFQLPEISSEIIDQHHQLNIMNILFFQVFQIEYHQEWKIYCEDSLMMWKEKFHWMLFYQNKN